MSHSAAKINAEIKAERVLKRYLLSKNFHGTVRVATKWTLRCVAVSLLHNAFKAPAAQFVVYAVLVALYARTRLLKMTGKKEYYREEKTE